jgi:ribosomal protein S18 acetylase RimI-like enzyme
MNREHKLSIRRAKKKDVGRLSELTGQLGYPTDVGQMTKRLESVLRDKHAACFVAETQDKQVIGWVHVSAIPLLEADLRAEVNGLVVEESARSQGAGWKLLQTAESWAKKMRCKAMSVRSNVLRERAHEFYLRNGYEHCKTQKAFRRQI